jgi:hypothetical protein
MVRIVEYYLPTPTSPAQIGWDFALFDTLPRLDDTRKAIIIVGLFLGMNSSSRGNLFAEI